MPRYFPVDPDTRTVHAYRTFRPSEDRTVCGITLTWVRQSIDIGTTDPRCPECTANAADHIDKEPTPPPAATDPLGETSHPRGLPGLAARY